MQRLLENDLHKLNMIWSEVRTSSVGILFHRPREKYGQFWPYRISMSHRPTGFTIVHEPSFLAIIIACLHFICSGARIRVPKNDTSDSFRQVFP